MDSTAPNSDTSPAVQPTAPQRQEGDATGDPDAAVSPAQSGGQSDQADKPPYHPWTTEEAVGKIWDHLGLGRHFVQDEEQSQP